MSPSCQKEICKKRNSVYGRGETYSGNAARHESDTSLQESDEPRQKKPRYSVEIKTITSDSEETFHPSIAENIKRRERKYSQSYDENQSRPAPGKESKRSPRHVTSCHPYGRRQDQPPANILIQIPQGGEKKTIYSNKICLESDKNHNKVPETEMTMSHLGNTRHTFPLQPDLCLDSKQAFPGQKQSTSSEVRTDSSQVGRHLRRTQRDIGRVLQAPEETAGDRQPGEEGKSYSQVRLQPSTQTQTFWQLREERNGAVLTDRNYKQICRSRKFK